MSGSDHERQVEQVIADYLAAEDAGAPPDRAAILAAHPDLAPDLQSFFREHDQFDRLAAPLRADATPTVGLAPGNSAPDEECGLWPGRQVRYFGDYEILEELGQGGMGVVYRARQVSLNRPVALKMIRAGVLADADDLRRFQNEVEAVALLDHQGVVPIFEVGQLEGQRYFSMKLIEGKSLASRLNDYQDDAKAAARLVADAAEAVAHAHARGVLHRDLKPANLLIGANGRPLITDFGLAKRLVEDVELTRSGAILGTPAYMSPEQAAGRRGTITTATDVYGLGAILYALLTGKAPFAGESLFETLAAVRTSAPSLPRHLTAKVPRDLETICLKCLEKEPGRRYATALALAEDLRAWLANRPIAARPAGVLERLLLFVRRKPAAAAIFALIATVLFLFGFGVSIAWLWRAAESARAQAEAARAQVAAVEYGRTVQAAYGELQSKNVAGALALLEGTRPEYRGWEWRYVSALCYPELATFVGPKGTFEPYFDEEGTRLATLDARGKIRFWDAGTGAELFRSDGRKFPGLDALSPDGARMVVPGEDHLSAVIRDLQSGSVLVRLKGHTSPLISALFDPEGKRVVTTSVDGRAKIWDAHTGIEIRTLGPPQGPAIFHASFSPDGTKLATGGEDGIARIMDVATGRELRAFKGHGRGLNRLEFSRDGKRLVTTSDDKTARVWDAASGSLLLTLGGHTRRVMSASFSRDGSRIVTASEDRTACLYDAKNGAALLTLCGHGAPVWSARFSANGTKVITAVAGGPWEPARIWDATAGPGSFLLAEGFDSARAAISPDGRRVATAPWGRPSLKPTILDARTGRICFTLEKSGASAIEFRPDGSQLITAGSDGAARIWDALSGRILRTLPPHTRFLTAASFSPDGSRVVTASADGRAKLWDLQSGEMLWELGTPAVRIHSVQFHPDGSRVVTADGSGAVILWDRATGAPLRTFSAHKQGALAAVFRQDGLRIVTGGHDNLAKVWDAATGEMLLSLVGHTGAVRCVAFSPDGTRIVTAGGDGSVKLWDAASGTEVLTLKGHADAINTAHFSPEGERIVTASDDGTVRIWDVRPFAAIQAERASALKP